MESKPWISLYLLLFIFFILIHPVIGDHPVFAEDADGFRPVFSSTLYGTVSPQNPMKIDLDIRDSETAFVRLYGFGENGTNWGLYSDRSDLTGYLENHSSDKSEYPWVLTLRNRSSDYILLDPGMYEALFTSTETSGEAEVLVTYVYHESLDMGEISNQKYSVWETEIPEGLERVIFMTESVLGTDLDLYIENDTSLPNRFEDFAYSSQSSCTECWTSGVDNYLSEMLKIDNPDPGTYLMVTYADGGDDYFFTYWIGIERLISPDTVNSTV